MQPFQCDLQAQIPKHPITTHTQAHPKQLEATVTMRQKKKANRPQPHPPHRRGTFHRRLQPLYTEKHKVSCSGFLPKTEPLQHHAAIPMRSASTDSKTPYNYAHTSTPKATWSHRCNAAKKKGKPTAAAPAAQTRYLSSPAAATLHGKIQGFVLRLPAQLTTSLPHRFPSSPLPIVTTSLRPLPFLTTSLPHHFPSSPPPFLTIPLHHHFPSSPLPIVTTSLRHHFPSSPLPIVTTSLRHHFPSSPLPFVTTSLRHHFPSSPLPFVTTSLRHPIPPLQCPSSRSIPPLLLLVLCIVMLCSYVLLCSLPIVMLCNYVLLCALPSFIKVNSAASYSCVMYCCVMYCYVIYHPSSRSIPPLLILLLCIVMLCIVRSRTTLYHSQFQQVKIIRNSEVLLPNFLW